MAVVEYVQLTLMLCLGAVAAISDIKRGIVPNRLVGGFAVCGILLDVIYLTLFGSDSVLVFVLNVITTTLISLCLYYTHALAGGDCKLIPVLS